MIPKPKRRTAYAKRQRHPAFLGFISLQPCIVCGRQPVEVCHVGRRGLAQKCSDLETLPACSFHHRIGPDSMHVLGKRFYEVHGLDKFQLISKFQAAYAQRFPTAA